MISGPPLRHVVLKKFWSKDVETLKELYQEILKNDPYWHFFWEGPDTYLRISPEFERPVIDFLENKEVKIDPVTDWEENIPITRAYQQIFQEMFHLFSVLSMEMGDDEFWYILERVTRCFLNNARTPERAENLIGSPKSSLDKHLWEPLCLNRIACERAALKCQILMNC